MKAILLLAVVGIAGGAMGIGFLNAPSIEVIAQQVGVGETDLTAPIDTIKVAFHITKTDVGDEFINIYDKCIVKAVDTLVQSSTIFCKLTDMSDRIVAEGSTVLQNTLQAGDTGDIELDMFITTTANNVENIHDVTIVVQDPF